MTELLAHYVGLERAIQSSVLIYLCLLAGFLLLPESKALESGEFVLSPGAAGTDAALSGAGVPGQTTLDTY